jgi:hypothetical protein
MNAAHWRPSSLRNAGAARRAKAARAPALLEQHGHCWPTGRRRPSPPDRRTGGVQTLPGAPRGSRHGRRSRPASARSRPALPGRGQIADLLLGLGVQLEEVSEPAPHRGQHPACARILAVARGVVEHTQQPADPLVVSQDHFDDVGHLCPLPSGRHWLAPAGSQWRVCGRGTTRVRPGDLRPSRVIPVFMAGLRISCSAHKGSDARSLIACRSRPRQVSRPQSGT